MKKAIVIFIAFCLFLSFSACSNTDADAELILISPPMGTTDASAEPTPTELELTATVTATETQAIPTISISPNPTSKPTPAPTLQPTVPPKATAKPIPTATITPAPTQTAITLDQYIESIQNEIDQIKTIIAAQGMDIHVFARNNSLVYSYTIAISTDDIESIGASLEDALNAQSSTFEVLFHQLKTKIPSAESIIVEYLTKDGTIICSKEFK
jgi:uncharacterized 29.3 kDa protein